MPEKYDKPKTYAEARKVYQSLSDQVAKLAAERPAVKAEITRRVTEELGDYDLKIEQVKAKKAAAALEMFDAEEREKPQAQAKIQSDAEAKSQTELNRRAEANAKRHKQQSDTIRHRMAAAVA